jgi:hypothetical protein
MVIYRGIFITLAPGGLMQNWTYVSMSLKTMIQLNCQLIMFCSIYVSVIITTAIRLNVTAPKNSVIRFLGLRVNF